MHWAWYHARLPTGDRNCQREDTRRWGWADNAVDAAGPESGDSVGAGAKLDVGGEAAAREHGKPTGKRGRLSFAEPFAGGLVANARPISSVTHK